MNKQRGNDTVSVSEPEKGTDGRWSITIRFGLKRDAEAFVRDFTARPPPGKRGGDWYSGQ